MVLVSGGGDPESNQIDPQLKQDRSRIGPESPWSRSGINPETEQKTHHYHWESRKSQDPGPVGLPPGPQGVHRGILPRALSGVLQQIPQGVT